MGQFARWLGRHEGAEFANYDALWRWSVSDLDGFWSAFRRYAGVGSANGPALALDSMPGARWFPGSSWNYALEMLKHDIEGPAIIAHSQTRPPIEMTMEELRSKVWACRAGLSRLGVGRGDRVGAYLPNIPEAVIGLLATASLGATWTSAAPEFGARAVVDRLGQVEPSVLIAVTGYRYGAERIDRSAQLRDISAQIPGLEHTVVVPYPDLEGAPEGALGWDEALGQPASPASHELVPFDHPLYVLYSSGTTGKPKAIIHGHGGIICEHLKVMTLHQDLGQGDRVCWFTTTGWMMWNFLVSGLLAGAGIVLFDGNPGSPDLLTLWRLAADTGVSVLGLSATFIEACRKEHLTPAQDLDLSRLRALGSTGAPLSAAAAAWATEASGPGVQVCSSSGGTDVCTAFMGASPVVAVRGGEMSCRYLGVNAQAWDEDGHPVVGRPGELVVTQPMPSMPVGFWGDDDGSRLAAAYYERHPGVWTHGDSIVFQPDGASAITGRTDAVLNRGGVRLGTAEIYEVLEELDEIQDSLIVHLEDGDELVLFIVTTEHRHLGDELEARIRTALRSALSPRHSPDRIVAVRAVPRTLTGKKLEIPVKQILQGADPDRVLSRGALRDPSALDDIVAAWRTGREAPS